MMYDDLTFNLIDKISCENICLSTNKALSSNQKLLAYLDRNFKLYMGY